MHAKQVGTRGKFTRVVRMSLKETIILQIQSSGYGSSKPWAI